MNKLGAIICDECRILIKYGNSENKNHLCGPCIKKEYVFYMIQENCILVSLRGSDSYKLLTKYKNYYVNLGEL